MPPAVANNINDTDMRKAMALAVKGRGRTAPNPMVGAVVVKKGRIIGRGYHARAGLAHAEVVALDNANVGKTGRALGGAGGADLYVTLEPCPVFGRTPPCTDAIIEAGIKRVFVGAGDPNPKVRGRGVRKLRQAGIVVTTGILKAECVAINVAYNKHIVSGLPYVTLKLATSLDGRIAASSGDSTWITSKESRSYVHELRNTVDCVMVGSGTALADNPRLTTRGVKGGRNPMRAVLDSSLSLPPDANIFKSARKTGVFVFTGKAASAKKADILTAKGATVIRVQTTKAGLSLKAVLKELGGRGVTDLMVEGGGVLAAGLLKAGLVDKVLWFTAPLIIGAGGLPSVAELGGKDMSRALRFKDIKIKTFGTDVLVEGCF
ncbi:Diaminohydroxyphosphoribosylaminopyrimidine deaminase / 5-amino-6-(5-phosphoribosylamino)uracil reductase [hydrothermal vent metagenome]|uniref:Diaminohydroxyphosphoribosylaminopyrimidine deaminase / 5-amino-6-(5-phosphoribosylamino)uracil reductase n=1 Tax=hydrothermal vent metagenome TaxID=652676 RepID=A0A3B0QTN6_9ZZZZ